MKMLRQIPRLVLVSVVDAPLGLEARIAALCQKVFVVVLYHLIPPVAQSAGLVD